MANIPVRIIGVSGGGAPQNTQPGVQTGIVSANPQQAEQRLQNAARYREDASRAQVDALSTAMQSISAEIQARSNNNSRFAEALGGIGAVAQAVTEWSSQRQEMQLKQREDLEERLSSEQHVQALQEAQSILDSSRDILYQMTYEKGVEVLNSRFEQVIQRFPNLNPEAVRQIRSTIYSELNSINGEMWRSQQRDLEELQDVRVATAIAQGRAAAGQGLMALRYRGSGATYQEKTEYFNQVVSSFTDSDAFRSLDPDSQLRAYQSFLEIAVEQLEGNEEAVQMAQGELERTQQSQNDIAQVQIAYENGLIDLSQRNAQIQQLNVANRTSVNPTSTFDQLNARLEEGAVWQSYNQMQTEQLIADAGPLMDMEVGNVVANILSGRASVSSLGDDPYGDQVRSALELYNTLYTGDYERLMRGMRELSMEEQSLARQLGMAQMYEAAYNAASEDDRKTLAERMGTEYAAAFNSRNETLQRMQEIRALQLDGNAQMNSIREQLIPYGLHQGYNKQAQFYNDPAMVEQRQAAAEARAAAQAAGQASFNYGREATQGPAPRPLAALTTGSFGLAEGAPIPFVAGTENIVITSGYHAHEGGRAGHNGVDFAPNGGGPAQVAAIRTGRVVANGYDQGGWGNFVAIEDQNGYRAIYAHLASASSVKVGDVVAQGQLLGDMGNTGGSRGAHLHLSVINPGGPIAESHGTYDPIAYINESVTEPGQQVLGAGMPPNGITTTSGRGPSRPGVPFSTQTEFVVANTVPPPGAFILPEQDGWVYGNTIYFRTQEAANRALSRRQAANDTRTQAIPGAPNTAALNDGPYTATTNVFSGANPQRTSQVSGYRRDYGPNNPEHNFGYRALQDDRSFRLALHASANRLGLPSQWLADVIAFETGGTFNPSEPNRAGSGATGLIQFMPSTARNLGTSTAALSQMTRAQQMAYVERYLAPYASSIQTITDMYMAVLWPAAIGRNPGEAIFQRGDGAYPQNSGLDLDGDGRVTVEEAARKIGPAGGRQYEFSRTQASAPRVVHDRPHAGCPNCQAYLTANASSFVTHMGIG